MEKVIKNFPEQIYLQCGDCSCEEVIDYNEMAEVSWCEDRIDDDDVRYVRADLYISRKELMLKLAKMVHHTPRPKGDMGDLCEWERLRERERIRNCTIADIKKAIGE